MQSTLLNHCDTTRLHLKSSEVQRSEFANINYQQNPHDMQLISQKDFIQNKEHENCISITDSDSVTSENQQSPSKSNSEYGSVSTNSRSRPNGILKKGKVEREMEIDKTSSAQENYQCEDGEIAPPSVRTPNSSSLYPMQTSRESGYFSSPGGIEVKLPQHLDNPIYVAVPDEIPEAKAEVLNEHIYETITVEAKARKPVIKNGTKPCSDPSSVESSNEKKTKQDPKNFCSHTLPLPKRKERVSKKDINKKLGEVDNRQPVASMAMDPRYELTYVDRVILELVETERMYVRALEDILAGYLLALKNSSGLPIKSSDVKKMFGNIKDIYAFNRKFLSDLENCESDPVKVGREFVNQDTSFSVYTEYCTNYPMSVSILTRCMKNSTLAQFFKSQQESLHHSLPLGAYLLKPVQRILKYHLILHEMVKNCDPELENIWVIEQALATMTYIARHINEMKRKHEDAVHIQELQSLLTNWSGDDLTTYGKIAVEGDLKLQGAKNDRLVFLFDKMILITKRREDGFLICKTHIMCSELILLESVNDNPLSFLIFPFDSSSMNLNSDHSNVRLGKQHILTARNEAEKNMWTQNIKRLTMENHHANIPLQAKESIMNMSRMKLEASRKDGRILPRKLFGKTLTTIDMNGKIRRRSESTSVIKNFPKIIKKRNDYENQEDLVSDAASETYTPVSKSRFTLPWINRSNSPKQDSNDVVTSTATEETLESATKEEKMTNERNGDMREEKSKEENDSDEKTDKSATKRSQKYKDSVVYKRYKRRKSQPITNNELRLSNNNKASPTPEQTPAAEKQEKKKRNDVAIEDFDSFDDFLSYNAETGRESVSWDIQIVEAVFDRFRKEDENNENKKEEADEEEEEDSSKEENEPAPDLNPGFDEANDLESEIEFSGERSESNETLVSESLDEATPTEEFVRVNDVIERTGSLPRKSLTESESSSTLCPSSEVFSQDNIATYRKELLDTESGDTGKDVIETSDANEESSVEAAENNEESESELSKSSSFSTRSSYEERRKYFEKLKEIRELRYANSSNQNYDADAIIQSGKVRKMIAHHRDHLASRVHTVNSASHRSQSSQDTENTDAAASARRFWSQKKSSREPAGGVASDYSRFGSQNSKNVDMDLVNNNRFSTMTTGNPPLHLASSSSSSTSSIDDADDHNNTLTSAPKYKALLQPRLLLWKSYFESNQPNSHQATKPISKAATEPTKQTERPGLSRQRLREKNAQKKRQLLLETSKTLPREIKKEQESEDPDNAWEDFETKARKFENLSRSSSSEKLRVKQPLKTTSFHCRTDCSSGTIAEKAAAFREAASKSTNTVNSSVRLRNNRHRFGSNRSSTSEIESPTTAVATLKRYDTFPSPPNPASKPPTSPIIMTPSRFNSLRGKSGSNLSLSSSSLNSSHPSTPSTSCTNLTESPIISSVKRSSSYRSREPLSSQFSRSHSSVASTLSRHNSETAKDFSLRSRRGARSNDSISILRRSSSYRSPDSVTYCSSSPRSRVSASLSRRHSSRVRREATSASSEEISNALPPSSPSSSRYHSKPIELNRSPSSSSLVRVNSLKNTRNFEAKKETFTPTAATERSGKNVLQLAQRFNEMSVASDNFNRSNPRSRWYRGRKHYSDLALPVGGIVSQSEIDCEDGKKKAQLRRHESLAGTKQVNERDVSPTRRLSDSCFPRASAAGALTARPNESRDYGSQRTNFATLEAKSPSKSHPRLQRSNTCILRNSNLSPSAYSLGTKSKPNSTAGSKAGADFLRTSEKEAERGPPSPDMVSRFCKV